MTLARARVPTSVTSSFPDSSRERTNGLTCQSRIILRPAANATPEHYTQLRPSPPCCSSYRAYQHHYPEAAPATVHTSNVVPKISPNKPRQGRLALGAMHSQRQARVHTSKASDTRSRSAPQMSLSRRSNDVRELKRYSVNVKRQAQIRNTNRGQSEKR